MVVTVTVDPGLNTDLTVFELYSDVDGYTVPFAVGVPIADLWPTGRTFYNVPEGTVDIKVVASGICSNEGTAIISTTTTTTIYEPPTIYTLPPTDIIASEAESGGGIDWEGTGTINLPIAAQGIEWARAITLDPGDPGYGIIDVGPNATIDEWPATMTGLTDGLQYYVRAWADLITTLPNPSPPVGDRYYGNILTLIGFVPPTLLTDVAVITDISAQGIGEVINVGSGEGVIGIRGIVWSLVTNPIIGGGGVTDIPGNPSRNPWNPTIVPLVVSTTYYIKSYAEVDGIIYYGPEVSFTTTAVVVPLVLTYPADTITDVSALGHGEVTVSASAVLDKGICWGPWPDPLITSASFVSSGPGIGVTDETMSPLVSLGTYYFKAYCITAEGTYYGVELEITTLGAPDFEEFSAAFGNTSIVACNTPNNTTIWIPAGDSWTSTYVIWGADDGTIVPPSGFYNIGGQVREWDSLAGLLGVVLGCTASSLITLKFGLILADSCFTPSRTLSLYIDTTSFETATGIWDDLAYTIPSPAGFYSFNGYVREWNGVNLLAYTPCISALVDLSYDGLSGPAACVGSLQQGYIDDSFALATGLWVDEALTIPMPSGFYSDNSMWRQWDGVSAFIEIGVNSCI